MLNMAPTKETPARTRKVILKQSGPKQVTECCFEASLSYRVPARRLEKRVAPRGLPRHIKFIIRPKCFRPKSSEAVGTIIEN